jgi:hypothetical protein
MPEKEEEEKKKTSTRRRIRTRTLPTHTVIISERVIL